MPRLPLPQLRARAQDPTEVAGIGANLAVSGATSLQHEQAIASRLQRQPDDVFGLVVTTTGGNDLIHDYGRTPPREGAMYGASLQQAMPWIEAYRQRLDRVIDDAEGRLRLLNARLDEATARTIELSVQASDVEELGGLGQDVDAMVEEMEALRQAVEETGGGTAVAGTG